MPIRDVALKIEEGEGQGNLRWRHNMMMMMMMMMMKYYFITLFHNPFTQQMTSLKLESQN